MTEHTELVAAFCGDDPTMLPTIQPIGWLYTMIQEFKEPEKIAANYKEDPDSYWMMIREVEGLYERASAALRERHETHHPILKEPDDSWPAEDYAARFDSKCRI